MIFSPFYGKIEKENSDPFSIPLDQDQKEGYNMRIITIGREFGSGGREVGKRLADALGFAYYDKEIISAIAEKSQLDETYVTNMIDHGGLWQYPLTFGHTLAYLPSIFNESTQIMVTQRQVITELAQKEDCIIVGRSADVILSALNPLKIFVYASKESKIKRCRSRAAEGESFTDRQLEKQMKQVDNARASLHQLLTEKKWGAKEGYHLCINTSDTEIKSMIPWLTAYAQSFFSQKEAD